MKRSAAQLREDALAIWQAGVDAVRSDRLVRDNLRIDGDQLAVGDELIPLSDVGRIVVVGTGKAGAGMSAGVEQTLGTQLMEDKQLAGWVNVPADCMPADCVQPLERITLHAARPAGVNEPTEAGVVGTRRILELVGSLTPRDLCLCLISGGGSALMPAPVDGISLTDKQAVTKFLSGVGANIAELNTVRKQLSQIKGGGLARACQAGRLISLIISDVIGDPLDIIASGPTVEDPATPQDALDVLRQFDPAGENTPPRVIEHLEHAARTARSSGERPDAARPTIINLIIGNNAVAVDAAGLEAERRGYSHAMTAATELEGHADDIGRHLAKMALRMRDESGPDCLITGGEPIVKLAPLDIRGMGGRNQQLVLAALDEILPSAREDASALDGIALLSGGTDGEDGPTDAAGAIIDASTITRMREADLAPAAYLARNDAYNFFKPLNALIKTGPTHTNVCDLRVAVVDRIEERTTS